MTEVTQYNDAFQKRKDKYEKHAYNAIKKTLDKQTDAFIMFVLDNGIESARNRIDSLFPNADLQETIQKVYTKVGLVEARYSYDYCNNLKRSKALGSISIDLISRVFLRMLNTFALRPETADKITKVNQRTKDTVREVIANNIEDLKGSAQIARKIRSELTQINKTRSLLIARTETTTIANYASLIGAQNTGLDLKKTWLSVSDNRTRDAHITSNGQSVGVNEAFMVNGIKMDYPGDPRGGASNVCNCRCTMIYRL